ncbi:phosphopantetheine-binding protein [Aliarcobacter butzleri]|uniref:phosphopantetheine-binding protein n=1 Tax=Aliarcobacter butzleri TaxID=28197 RepID=UPI000657FC04|nr:phosphopantetheine-binding protein [Aliarcobacter butzleri]KLD99092.1 acyl carrier protein [Aliarcobacter butzleri L349]
MSDLKYELKKLIIEECEKECDIDDIKDDKALFGPDSILELDSMDALQISMAIHKKYGLKTTDSKELRKIMQSINSLEEYLIKNA